MSVCRPPRIAAHPCSCAGVGVPSVSENHFWMTGWKRPRDMERVEYRKQVFGKHMYFRQSLTTALVCLVAAAASAATIVVDVRDPKAAPLADAVVYASPE